MDFLQQAHAIEDQIIAWRRHIHMNPELSFKETGTAKFVAENLHEMGIEAEVGVGITGVVARIGEGGPVVGIRADMDALPITEETGLPFASKNPGVMHACGHDAHTAMLLGVAKILNTMPDRPAGEIRLLFQPSEEAWDSEGKSGATRMIDDKALEGVDKVIALHVASRATSGKIQIGEGVATAAADMFYGSIKGDGAHGAFPHTGVDSIYVLAQVINAIHGIRARRLNPTENAVISLGSVHGGQAPNVIPHEIKVNGTIRSFNEATRDFLHTELEKAFAVARAFGGDYELKIERGYPPLYNAPEVAQVIREVTAETIGADNLEPHEPMMAGEDFSYMAQQAPGAMLNLGAAIGDMNRPHHSPIFDIDEKALPVGTAVLTATALRLLREQA